MADYIGDAAQQIVSLAGPAPDETQRAMQDHAAAASFPIIGPAAGGLLTALAQLTDADTVFEFGSGFGYSASWFARGMDAGGEIVLAEVDDDELELAREFLEGGDYRPSFRFELGDAVEIVERYERPFDIVLVDHDKARYVDGFERAREKVSPGGAVLADNMLYGPFTVDDVLEGLEGEPTDEATSGVVDYLTRLRGDPDFVTVVLPIGSGIALSVRRR